MFFHFWLTGVPTYFRLSVTLHSPLPDSLESPRSVETSLTSVALIKVASPQELLNPTECLGSTDLSDTIVTRVSKGLEYLGATCEKGVDLSLQAADP